MDNGNRYGAESGEEWGRRVMTNSKRWPNNAAWARDDAAEHVQRAIADLQPLLDCDDAELVARVGRALNEAHQAIRKLEAVGAQTLPPRL